MGAVTHENLRRAPLRAIELGRMSTAIDASGSPLFEVQLSLPLAEPDPRQVAFVWIPSLPLDVGDRELVCAACGQRASTSRCACGAGHCTLAWVFRAWRAHALERLAKRR